MTCIALLIFTAGSTDETDSGVNGFPSLQGLTGVEKLIPLNPESISEFSAIENGRNRDSKHTKSL